MKNLHIENSYNTWNISTMRKTIIDMCNGEDPEIFLNRTMKGMYIEWWLHNLGYWLTLPFLKNNTLKFINERCKHVDLEEH